MPQKRQLLRADGTSQDLYGAHTLDQIRKLIGADELDVISLNHLGLPLWVMIVDDSGWSMKRPRNDAATALYLKNCVPNCQHYICGDVCVLPDRDFADGLER